MNTHHSKTPSELTPQINLLSQEDVARETTAFSEY